MGAFKPSATVNLGGLDLEMVMGFGEAAEFERLVGQSVIDAFSGNPAIDSVIKFASIALRKSVGRRHANERWVAEQLDENPGDYVNLMNAIGSLIEQFFKGATEDGAESSEDPPQKVTALSTGTS